jgi:hypothetical protein
MVLLHYSLAKNGMSNLSSLIEKFKMLFLHQILGDWPEFRCDGASILDIKHSHHQCFYKDLPPKITEDLLL